MFRTRTVLAYAYRERTLAGVRADLRRRRLDEALQR
jgi:hypothetical protein